MRVISLGVLACVALAWALGFSAVSHRQQGIRTVATDVQPVVVESRRIESLLSGADASAANSFLAGGVEPADQRARYLANTKQAQDELARAAAGGGASARARDAIRTIAESTTTYAGLVESARANNRQGFPVGAGYLRRATALLNTTILPAADRLHEDSVVRLDAGYAAAGGIAAAVGVVVAAVVLFVALVAAQVFLRRRTNRVFNVGMVAATAVSVLLIGWTLFSLVTEGNQVAAARDRTDALNTLAQARVTAFGAKSDESFALIARGNGASKYDALRGAVKDLGGPNFNSGFLGEAVRRAAAGEERSSMSSAVAAFKSFLAAHANIEQLDSTGQSQQAIAAALAAGPGTANGAFDAFDQAIQRVSVLTQQEFDGHIRSARGHITGLAIGISLAFLLVAILVLYGFQQRIGEYR
jgi:tetrahydromethanopterin S-methyltransferase subunit F